MELRGFAGSILYVDLTSGNISKESLDPELVKNFVGGWGISLRMIYDLVPPEVDPISPENVIIVTSFPFNATFVPGSSQTMVVYKGSLNNTYTPSSGGGLFSSMLKSSGYDYVVIRGRAEKPVYLKIVDDGVELCDASRLWGKDIFETVSELRKRHEPCSVIAIGPSGEKLVNISVTTVDQGGGSLGEGGLCAIMGSKNLKAMVAIQGNREIRVADRVKLHRMVDRQLERIMNYHLRKDLMEGGGMAMTMGWIGHGGRLYGRNWMELEPMTDDDKAIAAAMLELHKQTRRPLACPSCPICDKDRVDYGGMITYDSEIMSPLTGIAPHALATTAALKSKDSYSQLLQYRDLTNRLGIDRLLFEPLLSLMCYLYSEGIISKQDTGGMEIKDDFDTTMKLVAMTAQREGFGDYLADGVLGACQRLGKGTEKYAAHIKGYTRLMDPRTRGLGTMEFSQIVNPRGSAPIAGSMGTPSYSPGFSIDAWVKQARQEGFSDEVIEQCFTRGSFNVARVTKHTEDWFSVMNCLGLCYRLYIYRFYSIWDITDFYSAVTGIDITPPELLKAGERVWNLYKLLNVRVGYNRKDDKPPEGWFTPVKERDGTEYYVTDYYRTKVLTKEDFEKMLDEYYDERGWDIRTGIPTPSKLEELGLGRL